jgi:MFS family permease
MLSGPQSSMAQSLLASLGVPSDYRLSVRRHALSWALFGVFSGGVVQQLGFIVRKTGGSPLLVSAVTAGPYTFALLTMLYASLLERSPARAVVASSRGLCAALFLFALFVPAPGGLAAIGLAALVVARVGEASYGRLLARMYPQKLRGRLQSLPMFANALTLAGASILAGWVLRSQDAAFRWFLPAVAPAGIAAALLVLRFPARADPEPASGGAPMRIRGTWSEIAHDRPFLAWMVVYSVASVGFWFVHSSLPVYYASVLHFDYWQNGVTLGVYNALYCLGFLFWGRVLDRFRSVRTMFLSWSLIAAGTLVTAIGQSYPAAVFGQALAGFGLAANDIAWYPVVLEFAPEHRVDRYMSAYMTVYGARALVGGAVSGLLMESSDAGSRTSLFVAALIMAAGCAGMLLTRRRLTPAPASP